MAIAISKQANGKLEKWYRAKPVFALMGEYSAGKSTLLNFLAGQQVAPTQVTATNLPPIWLTYSTKPYCKGLQGNGTETTVDLARDTSGLREHYLVLRIGVNAPRLREHDIIDTPGISDPNLPKGALRFLGKYLDFVVWCSAANQAWRQTEKTAWTKLAKAVRDDSILVLTRADKLRSEQDVDKVVRRVRKETTDLFHQVLPLKTTKAADVADDKRTEDADGPWNTTGGLDFSIALDRAIDSAKEKCAARQRITKSAKSKESATSTTGESNPSLLTCYQNFADEITKLTQNDRFGARLKTMHGIIQDCENNKHISHANILACLDLSGDSGLDLDKVMTQVEAEITVFSQHEWARLDGSISASSR